MRISASKTLITAGGGDQKAIAARREQVLRQYDVAPENIERDKFQERIAKLSGGTAMISAGGATPVEQKRRTQLIEDAINATRAAIEEGIVPGGGVALLRIAARLDELINRLDGGARQGAELLQRALSRPLFYIAANAGLNGEPKLREFQGQEWLRARRAQWLGGRSCRSWHHRPGQGLLQRGSQCGIGGRTILTTHTLIAKKPDDYDPTAGPARGGGAELL